MDTSVLLLAIASPLASCVAMLGGFIANKLITINSERSSCMSQLEEIGSQLIYYRGIRRVIDKNCTEDGAIRYVYHDIVATDNCYM